MLPSSIQAEAKRRRREAGVQPFVWPFVWASVDVPLTGLDGWTAGVRRGSGTRGRPASIHTRSGLVHHYHVRAERGNEPSGPVRARIGPETGRLDASVNQTWYVQYLRTAQRPEKSNFAHPRSSTRTRPGIWATFAWPVGMTAPQRPRKLRKIAKKR